MSSSDPAVPRPSVALRAGRDSVLLRSRHPWIYRQTLSGLSGEPTGGDLVSVVAADGRVIGWGDYSAQSMIAVRMVSYGEREPAEGWLAERIRAALALRERLGIDSDGVRLLNAEGDYVPGDHR